MGTTVAAIVGGFLAVYLYKKYKKKMTNRSEDFLSVH